MKICNICNKKKTIDSFRKYLSNGKPYVYGSCKDCERLKNNEYNKTHKQEQKQYFELNKDKITEYKKQYYIKNKTEIDIKNKKYAIEHKTELKKYYKEYKKKHKEHYKTYFKEYERNRKQKDALYKMKTQIRNVILKSFKRKRYNKMNNTEIILGCTYIEFYQHLLNTYKSNYGIEWNEKTNVHIDHIIPLSTAKTEEDVIKLCKYTNLQLLNATDNMKKGSKMDWMLGERI